MKKWKRLSTKLLLQHPRLSVYEDTVLLPSGHTTQYIHLGKHKDSAMVIAVDRRQKILVQKEYSYPTDKWLYQFPGGALEKGETPKQGALRELMEEASLTGKLEEIGWFYVDNRRKKDKFFVFVAHDIEPCDPIDGDPEEVFQEFWYTKKQIHELIKKGQVVNYSFLAGWALFCTRFK